MVTPATRPPESDPRTRMRHRPAGLPKIEPRRPSFDLAAENIGSWHDGNPYVTHFFNGLSLTFPEGERLFIDAVRRFEDGVDDPKLDADIRAFLTQEGIHRLMHDRYNEFLRRDGYPGAPLEWMVGLSLKSARLLWGKWQLALTCALEHVTATLSDRLLSDPRLLEGADPEYAAFWKWHAREEIEHKGVAFDLYERVAPGLPGYLMRVAAMSNVAVTTLPFFFVQASILATRDRPIPDPGEVRRALQYLFEDPGLVRQGFWQFASYFRSDFHPWKHHNAHLVEDRG